MTMAMATGMSQQKQVYYAKQEGCTCISLFCAFLCHYCMTPNFMFYGGCKQAMTNFLSLFKLECSPQEINSREISPH